MYKARRPIGKCMTFTLASMVLVGASVGVVAAGVSAARFRGRTMPTGRADHREGKRVNCRGSVHCPEPLLSPVTGTQVLAYRVEVHGSWTEDAQIKTRKITELREVASLSVDDGSGPLAVEFAERDKLFPECVTFDQSRSISLAKSVMDRPELFGPLEFPVAPNLVPGGLDRARVVERVVPIPTVATAVGAIRGGILVGGRHFPLWLDGTARRPWHLINDWLLPALGDAVLSAVRRMLDRGAPRNVPNGRT